MGLRRLLVANRAKCDRGEWRGRKRRRARRSKEGRRPQRGCYPMAAYSPQPPTRRGTLDPQDPGSDSTPVLILLGPLRISDETEAQIRTRFH